MYKYPPKVIDIPVPLLVRGVFKVWKYGDYTDKIKDIFEMSYGRDVVFGHSVRSLFSLLLADYRTKYSNLIFSSVTLGDMLDIAKHHNYSISSFDSYENSLSPNIDSLREQLEKQPKSIVVLTPLFGEIIDITEYRRLCDEHDSLLIVDAAQGFRGLGFDDYSLADALLYSFGPIKTMTALGGGIVVMKDSALARRFKEAVDDLPMASMRKFRFRLFKYSLITFLSRPAPYYIFVWLTKMLRVDLDRVSKNMTRSYKAGELLAQISVRPNWLQAWLLWRQMVSYPADAIEKRVALGGIADGNIDNNFKFFSKSTYWLYPYIRPSAKAESILVSRGCVPTKDTSSLVLVDPGNTSIARDTLAKLSYLPLDWRMSSRDIARMIGHEGVQITKVDNYSRLHGDFVNDIWQPSKVGELVRLLRKFPEKNILTIGRLKSHGNHTKYSGDHSLLDLSQMNKMKYDSKQQILEVGAGATWGEIHHFLNPLALSTVCQQSSIDFSVGGSISGNIHGRDIASTSIEKSVAWMDVVLASGETIHCTRQKNRRIFWLMFGSQGSLGIVVRAGLYVTKNTLMRTNFACIQLSELNEWFDKHKKNISLFIARPMVDKLTTTNPTTMLTYWSDTGTSTEVNLTGESNVAVTKFIFWISHKHHVFMSLRHFLERQTSGGGALVSRTNAFRPPVAPLKMFYTKSKNFHYVVQELFCPVDSLVDAMSEIYRLSTKYKVLQLTGVTIRRIEPQKSHISYASDGPVWAVMQYWKVPANQVGLAYHKFIQKQLAVICDNTQSKPYISYASDYEASDIVRWYPGLAELIKLKSELDPNSRLESDFIASIQDCVKTHSI